MIAREHELLLSLFFNTQNRHTMSKNKSDKEPRADPQNPQKRQNGSNNYYEQQHRPKNEKIPPNERDNLSD